MLSERRQDCSTWMRRIRSTIEVDSIGSHTYPEQSLSLAILLLFYFSCLLFLFSVIPSTFSVHFFNDDSLHDRVKNFHYKKTESGATLTCSSEFDKGNGKYQPANVVERVVIWGLKQQPKIIRIKDGAELTFYYNSQQQQLVVRKPWVKVVDDWVLEFSF